MEYNKKIFSFKNHAENEAGEIVLSALFFLKTLYLVKTSGLLFDFTIF